MANGSPSSGVWGHSSCVGMRPLALLEVRVGGAEAFPKVFGDDRTRPLRFRRVGARNVYIVADFAAFLRVSERCRNYVETLLYLAPCDTLDRRGVWRMDHEGMLLAHVGTLRSVDNVPGSSHPFKLVPDHDEGLGPTPPWAWVIDKPSARA